MAIAPLFNRNFELIKAGSTLDICFFILTKNRVVLLELLPNLFAIKYYSIKSKDKLVPTVPIVPATLFFFDQIICLRCH